MEYERELPEQKTKDAVLNKPCELNESLLFCSQDQRKGMHRVCGIYRVTQPNFDHPHTFYTIGRI